MTHAIIQGNPVNGFNVIGPFEEYYDAETYADGMAGSEPDYWIIEMVKPDMEDT